jgi:hypothetical protein
MLNYYEIEMKLYAAIDFTLSIAVIILAGGTVCFPCTNAAIGLRHGVLLFTSNIAVSTQSPSMLFPIPSHNRPVL